MRTLWRWGWFPELCAQPCISWSLNSYLSSGHKGRSGNVCRGQLGSFSPSPTLYLEFLAWKAGKNVTWHSGPLFQWWGLNLPFPAISPQLPCPDNWDTWHQVGPLTFYMTFLDCLPCLSPNPGTPFPLNSWGPLMPISVNSEMVLGTSFRGRAVDLLRFVTQSGDCRVQGGGLKEERWL